MADQVSTIVKMALGILEPKGVEHVPGTVYVYRPNQPEEHELSSNHQLKKDPTRRIFLVPQPSDDPNDPLVRLSYVAAHN